MTDQEITNSMIVRMREKIERLYRWRIINYEILDEEHATWAAHVTTAHSDGDREYEFCVLVSGMEMVTIENSCLRQLSQWAATLATVNGSL
jgi:hypothetical protein